MRASARIETALRNGRSTLIDARSEPPVALRRTPDRVLLVGSAAAPVGGDELDLDVVVGPHTHLALGTAAATVIWPGPSAEGSRVTTRCDVGEGGSLDWRPEPTILVAGSRHRSLTQVTLGREARVAVVEEVALGRTGEEPGHLELELRITRDGQPVVHHTERLGPGVPGWGSTVGAGTARHLVAAVHVGIDPGEPRTLVDPGTGSAAWLPVGADAAVVFATGPDRPAALGAAAAVTQTGHNGGGVERLSG